MPDPREYYTDRQDRSDIDDEHFESDLLASALAEIRGRGYRNGAACALCARLSDCADIDVPRLLAAVDAVLAIHQMEPGMFPPQCGVCVTSDNNFGDLMSEIGHAPPSGPSPAP